MKLQNFAEVAPQIAITDDAALAHGAWREAAEEALATTGAVLLRGDIRAADAVERALLVLSDQLLEDAFWSTPRSKVLGKTLTATEYPSPRTIQLHSEMAYMKVWPRFVAFHALEVAAEGGQTTVCDIDAVSAALGALLELFDRKGVTYHRTFQKGVDIPWQQAFQTQNRSDVERVGASFGMKVEWLANDALSTSHTAQGCVTAAHGQLIYFNQSHLFHSSLLDPRIRQGLEKLYGPGRLPRDATFGDGAPIETDQIDAVRAAFERYQTAMCWREGDLLILDNMRFAHGRLPFAGSRRVHVAMAKQESAPVRRVLPLPVLS
ncbi:TauD/TfdA family dioxygenase [Sphingomonas sp. S2-65]|uniref:TauD/TfdA family dioxygenase n=1 Tax=Sphingomonas sp. S2-65 TaxID=2903960 RepID=UPI001F3C858E|nr:TauD/TfdA family dioxygenase [Sphingomonas sp. S2-65]UYY57073.1 TauD/TfdA family dioxygenase [Sphingomonas sp. S2-65]